MNRLLRIAAALLLVASAVALLTTDDTKLFALPLIAGNLLSLVAHYRDRRE